MGDGIILGDKPSGHSFVLRDLIDMNMHTLNKVSGKTCLKIIRDNFFSKYVVCDQEMDRMRHEGKS